MAQQVRDLGVGLRFTNSSVPDGAQTPEVGAEFVYDRSFSANARRSPVGIEVWVFGERVDFMSSDLGDPIFDYAVPLHGTHEAYLRAVYDDIYGWDSAAWEATLGDAEEAQAILRKKSDFFWESLAQQLAERVFDESTTSPVYRFGPHCLKVTDVDCEQDTDCGEGLACGPDWTCIAAGCKDAGLRDARRVVVRTTLDARRDPMNPVTRSITYIADWYGVEGSELFFELQVPNGLRVAGPHQELLDFRPRIDGRQDAVGDIGLWAHLPQGRQPRTRNVDYPDYNLLFVPLRHLVVQGEVEDPKVPATGADYPNTAALIARIDALVYQLRTPKGGRAVSDQLTPFLTAKYYYMFEAGGQGIASYRDYILGETAGIARGLSPHFGRVELVIDGVRAASFAEPVLP